MKNIAYNRIVLKDLDTPGEVPTIPYSGSGLSFQIEDHTQVINGYTWLDTDIYENELCVNSADERVFIRTATGIKELFYSGQTQNFTSLGDVPLSYTGYDGYYLSVNSAETGLEFVEILDELVRISGDTGAFLLDENYFIQSSNKIRPINIINDTNDTGATNELWSSDKVYKLYNQITGSTTFNNLDIINDVVVNGDVYATNFYGNISSGVTGVDLQLVMNNGSVASGISTNVIIDTQDTNAYIYLKSGAGLGGDSWMGSYEMLDNGGIKIKSYLLGDVDDYDSSFIRTSYEECLVEMGVSRASNISSGVNFTLSAIDYSTIFTDRRLTKSGIEYYDDYSAEYTDRSLVDRGYVNGLQLFEVGSGSYSIMTKNRSNTSNGVKSTSFGDETIANGNASHAEGRLSKTEANAYAAHAEGNTTIASGSSSHAEGSNTKSIGSYSHAEGIYTQSKGIASHAEGNTTIANKDFSHTGGVGCIANNYADWVRSSGYINEIGDCQYGITTYKGHMTTSGETELNIGSGSPERFLINSAHTYQFTNLSFVCRDLDNGEACVGLSTNKLITNGVIWNGGVGTIKIDSLSPFNVADLHPYSVQLNLTIDSDYLKITSIITGDGTPSPNVNGWNCLVKLDWLELG